MKSLLVGLITVNFLLLLGWVTSFFKVFLLTLNMPGLHTLTALAPGTIFCELLFNSEYAGFTSNLEVTEAKSEEYAETSPLIGHFDFFAGPYDAPFQITIALPIWAIIFILSCVAFLLAKLAKTEQGAAG